MFTGFDHKVVPHVNYVFEILGQKSGPFTATVSVDIESLTPQSLKCDDSPQRSVAK